MFESLNYNTHHHVKTREKRINLTNRMRTYLQTLQTEFQFQ